MGNDQSVDDKGTELEKIQADQDAQDAVFSDAFDTAEKTDGVADDTGGAGGAGTGGTQDDSKGGDTDLQQANQSDADKQAAAQAAAQSGASTSGTGEDYEHKWKSLQGILKSDREKYEAEKTKLVTELESVKKTVAELTAQSDKKDKDKKDTGKSGSWIDDLTDDQKAELSDYEKDFDTVSKMEGLKRDKALKALEDRILENLTAKLTELNTQIDSRVKPVEETFKETEERVHFQSIRDAHSDFEKHRDSGAILKWIETKPRYLQESMKATYSEGAAEDVIELITDFKTENGLLENNQNDQSHADNLIDMEKRKAEKKQNLAAVITKRGSVDAGKGRADDFDSAYNEALKQ